MSSEWGNLSKMCQQRDGLQSLAQTHFISQNTIDALLVQVDEPVHAFELIRLERESQQERLIVCQH